MYTTCMKQFILSIYVIYDYMTVIDPNRSPRCSARSRVFRPGTKGKNSIRFLDGGFHMVNNG